MNMAIDDRRSGSHAGNVLTVANHAPSIDAEAGWQQTLFRISRIGSAGVVAFIQGYGLYLAHIGTSPIVFDSREVAGSTPASLSEGTSRAARTGARQWEALRLSSADQVREVLAALSLNKTQLAEVLAVSRPTLYDWLDGKEPNLANGQRLATVLKLLANADVTSAGPLSPRSVRQPLAEGTQSLLDVLKADSLDELLVSRLIREAKAIGTPAEARRLSREQRLAALGFEEPSDEQRKEQLARNVAMREWPRG